MLDGLSTHQFIFHKHSKGFSERIIKAIFSLVMLIMFLGSLVSPLNVKAITYDSSPLQLEGFYFREREGEETLHIRIRNVTPENHPTRFFIRMIEKETENSIFSMLMEMSVPSESFRDIRLRYAVKGEVAPGEYVISISAALDLGLNQLWDKDIVVYVAADGSWILEENLLIEVDIEELERVEAPRARNNRVDFGFWQRILVLAIVLVLTILIVLLSTRRDNAIAQGLRRKSMFKLGATFLPLALPLGLLYLFGQSPRTIGLLIGGGFFFALLIPWIKMDWELISKSNYMSNIVEFAGQSPDPRWMMKRLEETWKNGKKITFAYRVDEEFLVFGDGRISGVVPWEEVEKVEMHMDVFQGERDMYFSKRYVHTLGLWVHLKCGDIQRLPMNTVSIHTDEMPKYFNKIVKKMFDFLTEHHPNIVLEEIKGGSSENKERVLKEYKVEGSSKIKETADSIDWDNLKSKK